MKTVLETIQSGTPWLERAGVESPRLNMEHLLASVLQCRRLELYLQFNRVLEESELAPLRELVRRRARREPLQHVLGTVEFHGREFRCDARALIPRPETEELVSGILAAWKQRGSAGPPHLLDMGAGSGVIGISLLHAIPGSTGVLVDLSPEALTLAAENAQRTGLPADRFRLVTSDLLTEVAEGGFDLVAANLPYISAGEIESLSPEVQHDPRMALDGGPDGTGLIRRFLAELPDRANPGALVALEVGAGQTADLAAAMRDLGYRAVRCVYDLSGRDRFVFAESPAADRTSIG